VTIESTFENLGLAPTIGGLRSSRMANLILRERESERKRARARARESYISY
jgi:hypothetical protein